MWSHGDTIYMYMLTSLRLPNIVRYIVIDFKSYHINIIILNSTLHKNSSPGYIAVQEDIENCLL